MIIAYLLNVKKLYIFPMDEYEMLIFLVNSAIENPHYAFIFKFKGHAINNIIFSSFNHAKFERLSNFSIKIR